MSKINNKFSYIIILCLFLLCSFQKQDAFAQTQSQLSQNSYQEYLRTDKELNVVYQKILKQFSSDKQFLTKLQKAELAWIKFRDAHLESLFPEENKQQYYGSIYPTCQYNVLTQLTRERINQLKLWLDGCCEGDVCSGSIPVNPNKSCQ